MMRHSAMADIICQILLQVTASYCSNPDPADRFHMKFRQQVVDPGRVQTRLQYKALDARLVKEPERMRVRRQTAGHPFGTLKAWMGHTHSRPSAKSPVRQQCSGKGSFR